MSDPNAGGQSGAGPAPVGQGSSGEGPPPGDEGSGAKTLTQEQVASIVAEERRKALAPYSDYEQIKARLAEMEQAGATELEKATAKASTAVAERDAAVVERDRLLIRAAVISEAVRAGAVDPDVVAALLGGTLVVKDGQVEGDVGALVKQLLEERPFLRADGTSRSGSADGGSHSRKPPAAATPTQAMDALFRAR